MTKEAVSNIPSLKVVPPWENKAIHSRLKTFCTPLHLHVRQFCAFQGLFTFQIQKIVFLREFARISKPKRILSGWILELGPSAWLPPVWLTRWFPSKDGSKSFFWNWPFQPCEISGLLVYMLFNTDSENIYLLPSMPRPSSRSWRWAAGKTEKGCPLGTNAIVRGWGWRVSRDRVQRTGNTHK